MPLTITFLGGDDKDHDDDDYDYDSYVDLEPDHETIFFSLWREWGGGRGDLLSSMHCLSFTTFCLNSPTV